VPNKLKSIIRTMSVRTHARPVIAAANNKPKKRAPQAIKSAMPVMPVIIGCKISPRVKFTNAPLRYTVPVVALMT